MKTNSEFTSCICKSLDIIFITVMKISGNLFFLLFFLFFIISSSSNK